MKVVEHQYIKNCLPKYTFNGQAISPSIPIENRNRRGSEFSIPDECAHMVGIHGHIDS